MWWSALACARCLLLRFSFWFGSRTLEAAQGSKHLTRFDPSAPKGQKASPFPVSSSASRRCALRPNSPVTPTRVSEPLRQVPRVIVCQQAALSANIARPARHCARCARGSFRKIIAIGRRLRRALSMHRTPLRNGLVAASPKARYRRFGISPSEQLFVPAGRAIYPAFVSNRGSAAPFRSRSTGAVPVRCCICPAIRSAVVRALISHVGTAMRTVGVRSRRVHHIAATLRNVTLSSSVCASASPVSIQSSKASARAMLPAVSVVWIVLGVPMVASWRFALLSRCQPSGSPSPVATGRAVPSTIGLELSGAVDQFRRLNSHVGASCALLGTTCGHRMMWLPLAVLIIGRERTQQAGAVHLHPRSAHPRRLANYGPGLPGGNSCSGRTAAVKRHQRQHRGSPAAQVQTSTFRPSHFQPAVQRVVRPDANGRQCGACVCRRSRCHPVNLR